MQRLLQFLVLISALGGFSSPAWASEGRSETLRAINWVENPTNHHRRGSKGELGPYQFRSQTWRLHTKRPFALAVERRHADEVAILHYEWIRRGLRDAGIDPNPYNVALAWNSGLGAVTTGRVPTVSYHYAQRVANLVESQQQRRLASTQPAPLPAVAAAPAVVFSLQPPAPRFVLTAAEALYEPVVVTEKAESAPAIRHSPVALAFVAVTAPPVTLLP